jgi:hypothetical protein
MPQLPCLSSYSFRFKKVIHRWAQVGEELVQNVIPKNYKSETCEYKDELY